MPTSPVIQVKCYIKIYEKPGLVNKDQIGLRLGRSLCRPTHSLIQSEHHKQCIREKEGAKLMIIIKGKAYC